MELQKNIFIIALSFGTPIIQYGGRDVRQDGGGRKSIPKSRDYKEGQLQLKKRKVLS